MNKGFKTEASLSFISTYVIFAFKSNFQNRVDSSSLKALTSGLVCMRNFTSICPVGKV